MDKRVMIVDDNDFVRDSVVMFFRTEGIDILTAANGFECLHLLEKGFKGVILLDIQMPGMDGWETIRRMVERDLHRDNIIVLLSAKADRDDNSHLEEQRYITDFLTKPFHPKDLLQSVKHYATFLKPDRQAAAWA